MPYVDFFVPSVEELCFMLDKERFKNLCDMAQALCLRPPSGLSVAASSNETDSFNRSSLLFAVIYGMSDQIRRFLSFIKSLVIKTLPYFPSQMRSSFNRPLPIKLSNSSSAKSAVALLQGFYRANKKAPYNSRPLPRNCWERNRRIL